MFERVDVSAALSKFLLQYRNCDHATTGVSPAVALQGRRLRSRLDALRPDIAAVVRERQQKRIARLPGVNRQFEVGDAVLARDYSVKGDKWAEATVIKKTGPVSYKVGLAEGVEWRRHADQIIPINKNRYSLSRMSDMSGNRDINPELTKSGVVEDGAEDDMFEDAADDGGGVGTEATVTPLQTDTLPSQSQSPVQPSSPPPAVALTARALRALKRAKQT
jgi:hypothetical protein